MSFLSDAYIFPLFQVALLGSLAWCLGLDGRSSALARSGAGGAQAATTHIQGDSR
jgi:hypothetical protein